MLSAKPMPFVPTPLKLSSDTRTLYCQKIQPRLFYAKHGFERAGDARPFQIRLDDSSIGSDEERGRSAEAVSVRHVGRLAEEALRPVETIVRGVLLCGGKRGVEVEADEHEAFVLAPRGLGSFEIPHGVQRFQRVGAPEVDQHIRAFVSRK